MIKEPMTSLNPVFTIGEQIAESCACTGAGARRARAAKKMLDQVRIPVRAEEMLSRYPHQLSGGMRQRVMIAMALSRRPAVIADEQPRLMSPSRRKFCNSLPSCKGDGDGGDLYHPRYGRRGRYRRIGCW